MQVRMLCDDRVTGSNRKAGDLLDTSDAAAKRLIKLGLATSVCDGERRKSRPVPANRLKFANLIKMLDPKDADFAEHVAQLQAEYEAREKRIGSLCAMLHGTVDQDGTHKILEYDKEAVAALKAELAAAVERFVVDRY